VAGHAQLKTYKIMSLKFNQKQMHVVSQMFMAAGKAGHAFDLGRFTKDAVYASEVLARLSIAPQMEQSESFNALVQASLQVMTEVTAVAITAPAPLAASAPIAPDRAAVVPIAQDRYVGRLR
jgi:hypothetical protein